jgi:Cell division protein CrgA
MPESRLRKKGAFTPPPPKSSGPRPSPRWFAPVMVGLLILGLVWVVVFYLSQTKYPVPDIGNYNLVAGFGILLFGFGMLTRWR